MKLVDIICPKCKAVETDVILFTKEYPLCQQCNEPTVLYIGNCKLGSGQEYRVMAARKGIKTAAKRKSKNHKDNRKKKKEKVDDIK